MDRARATAMASELKNKSVGGWTVFDLVGCGRSALVLKAQKNERAAALKVFEPELVERFGKRTQLGRISRECSLIGKYHENLIRILDGGECALTNLLFVVMELLDCPNLASVLNDVPRQAITGIIRQVAAAAEFLEQNELVHRDIKPDNIVIDATFSKAVLLDLGVLKPVGVSGLTDEDSRPFIGTLQYSSPEYLNREEDDTIEGWRAHTFYQLGTVLHDLIMRRRIFDHHQPGPYIKMGDAVRNEAPRIDDRDVEPSLVTLARNCLLKDPKERIKFVTWEHFKEAGFKPFVEIARQDQILQLQAHARDIHGQAQSQQVSGYDYRIRLQEVLASVQSSVRNECIPRANIFPPAIARESRISATKGELEFNFERSPIHGFVHPFGFRVQVEVTDAAVPLIEIKCLSFYENTETAEDQKPQEKIVYKGAFTESAVAKSLIAELYNIIEKILRRNITENLSSAEFDTGPAGEKG